MIQDSHKSISVAIAHIPNHVSHVTSPSVSTPWSHDPNPEPQKPPQQLLFSPARLELSRCQLYMALLTWGVGLLTISPQLTLHKGFRLISFPCHLRKPGWIPFFLQESGTIYVQFPEPVLYISIVSSLILCTNRDMEFLFLSIFFKLSDVSVLFPENILQHSGCRSSNFRTWTSGAPARCPPHPFPSVQPLLWFFPASRPTVVQVRQVRSPECYEANWCKMEKFGALQNWWRSLLSKPVSERGHDPSSWFPVRIFFSATSLAVKHATKHYFFKTVSHTKYL